MATTNSNIFGLTVGTPTVISSSSPVTISNCVVESRATGTLFFQLATVLAGVSTIRFVLGVEAGTTNIVLPTPISLVGYDSVTACLSTTASTVNGTPLIPSGVATIIQS